MFYGFIVFTSCNAMTEPAVGADGKTQLLAGDAGAGLLSGIPGCPGSAVDTAVVIAGDSHDRELQTDGLRHRSHAGEKVSDVHGEHKDPSTDGAFIIPGDCPSARLEWVYKAIECDCEKSLDNLKKAVATGFHSNWFYRPEYKGFKTHLEESERYGVKSDYEAPDPFTCAVILACLVKDPVRKAVYMQKVRLLYKPDLRLTHNLPINGSETNCYCSVFSLCCINCCCSKFSVGGHVAYAASYNQSDLVLLLLELGLTWDAHDGLLSDGTTLSIPVQNAIKNTAGYQVAEVTSRTGACAIQ